jgi:hypothetical protein
MVKNEDKLKDNPYESIDRIYGGVSEGWVIQPLAPNFKEVAFAVKDLANGSRREVLRIPGPVVNEVVCGDGKRPWIHFYEDAYYRDYPAQYSWRVCEDELLYSPWDIKPLKEVDIMQQRDFMPNSSSYQPHNRAFGKDKIMLTAPIAESPGVVEDISIWHELSHTIFEDVLSHLNENNRIHKWGGKPAFRINERYVSAAERVKDAWEQLGPFNLKDYPEGLSDEEMKITILKDHPAAATLTESLYVTEEGMRRIGHPWDSEHEVFASTMTILRYLPEQFIQRYKLLDSDDQHKVANAVNATLGVLEVVNSSADVSDIIPEIKRIRGVLKH